MISDVLGIAVQMCFGEVQFSYSKGVLFVLAENPHRFY
jgi:hypothetical protein